MFCFSDYADCIYVYLLRFTFADASHPVRNVFRQLLYIAANHIMCHKQTLNSKMWANQFQLASFAVYFS